MLLFILLLIYSYLLSMLYVCTMVRQKTKGPHGRVPSGEEIDPVQDAWHAVEPCCMCYVDHPALFVLNNCGVVATTTG